jgi:hypothetical protein
VGLTIDQLEAYGCFQDDSAPLQPGIAPNYPTGSRLPEQCSDSENLAAFQRGFRAAVSGRRYNLSMGPVSLPASAVSSTTEDEVRERLNPNNPTRRACNRGTGSDRLSPRQQNCCDTGYRYGLQQLYAHIFNGLSGEEYRDPPGGACTKEFCTRLRDCRNAFNRGMDEADRRCTTAAETLTCSAHVLSDSGPIRFLGCYHLGVQMRYAQGGCSSRAAEFLESSGIPISNRRAPGGEGATISLPGENEPRNYTPAHGGGGGS